MRYFLFVLLFVFSTQGFSDKEWYYVGEAEDGLTQLYFNKNKLAKRDGKLFVWMMVSEKVRRSYGKSAKELILTDCKIPYSYEQLSLTFFEEEMGKGDIVFSVPNNKLAKGLQYAVSNSLKEAIIARACNF